MNNDVQPLNFRSELKQTGDKDPYFPAAPAWSTLSGGRQPDAPVHAGATLRVAARGHQFVPSVKGVEIYMIEGATQTLTTLPDLCAREIVMVPVPYLPVASSFSAPNVGVNDAAVQRANADVERAHAAEATAKAAEATALTQLKVQATFIADLQKRFDAQVDQVKEVQEQLKAMATAKASVPKPNQTARPNPRPCPIPGLAVNRSDPAPKPNAIPKRNPNPKPNPAPYQGEVPAPETPKRASAAAELPETEVRTKRTCAGRKAAAK